MSLALADAPASSTVLRAAPPHPALAPYVRSYLGAEQGAAETAAVGALPSAVLMVTWGGPVVPLIEKGPPGPLPLVSITGAFTESHRVRIGAGCQGFHVRFAPTGARALLGDRPAHDVWEGGLPDDVTRWAEAVAEAPSFEARVALADAFWRRRIPPSEVWSDAAVRLVAQAGGGLSVSDLADTLGVSDRTLRRRFFADVGLGAKTFAQIERYRRAHGYLLRTPGATWRDVCERFGYFDQAHFDRAFRRFTGESPTTWRPEARGLDLGMGLRDEGA